MPLRMARLCARRTEQQKNKNGEKSDRRKRQQRSPRRAQSLLLGAYTGTYCTLAPSLGARPRGERSHHTTKTSILYIARPEKKLRKLTGSVYGRSEMHACMHACNTYAFSTAPHRATGRRKPPSCSSPRLRWPCQASTIKHANMRTQHREEEPVSPSLSLPLPIRLVLPAP